MNNPKPRAAPRVDPGEATQAFSVQDIENLKLLLNEAETKPKVTRTRKPPVTKTGLGWSTTVVLTVLILAASGLVAWLGYLHALVGVF